MDKFYLTLDQDVKASKLLSKQTSYWQNLTCSSFVKNSSTANTPAPSRDPIAF